MCIRDRPGVAYTGACEGCDFAFETTPALESVTGTESEDCIDLDDWPPNLYIAHAPEFTLSFGGYGYGYYDDYGYPDADYGSTDTGDWEDEPYVSYDYTITDVFLIGYNYGGSLTWYPQIFTTPSGYSYGEFSWVEDHVVADQMQTWSGTDISYTFSDWCYDYYYYEVEIEDEDDASDEEVPDDIDVDMDTGWWDSGPDPVEGDQVITGTLACGEEESEMPYADVFTSEGLTEGDTLTVTMDGSTEDLNVWINGADGCVVDYSWYSSDCPDEVYYCYTSTADIESADPVQVIVQRGCWEDVETVADYTLRVDSASYDSEDEVTLVNLTSDDAEAATMTEYSETNGWVIEGDVSW